MKYKIKILSTQMSENFDFIFEIDDIEIQEQRLARVIVESHHFITILKHGLGFESGNWGMGKNLPEKLSPDSDYESLRLDTKMPDGYASSSLVAQWQFIKKLMNGEYAHISKKGREDMFLDVCISIHYKDVYILNAMKEGTLLELYPKLEPHIKFIKKLLKLK